MDGKQGKYVYYQKENEPNRIYCMDYAGTFRDRLVYETSETITEYRLLNHGMELEKIAVLVNHEQIIVADAETAAYKTVYDKEYIQTIVEFSYNEEDDTCIVVFQDENYYNVIVNAETGKLSYGAQ